MFKTPKHRSFNYKPIIYDEQKERKKEYEKLIEEQQSGTIDDKRRLERLRGRMSDSWGTRSNRKQESINRMWRLLAILGGLLVAAWKLFRWIDVI